MTMHLAQGLSTINTRKRKTKITKAKMSELQENWRLHNKNMKQKNMHDCCYNKFEDYLDYCFGRVKKPNPTDRKYFKSNTVNTSWRLEQDKEHRQKYPSLMEQAVAKGEFCSMGGSGTKKEPMKYTGTLIKGIATMHKSNAVPVIDDQHMIDIARMRRG